MPPTVCLDTPETSWTETVVRLERDGNIHKFHNRPLAAPSFELTRAWGEVVMSSVASEQDWSKGV
jgi:hypothetical protein